MKNVEIPKWLERLPLAPEFRPTDSEFADPIAYISKIEKEASAFGICKVIPPLPRPSRKYVLQNLNKSLSKWQELGSDVNFAREGFGGSVDGGESRAVFTTRQQELGCEMGKKAKDSVGQKQVWQSGEVYTLEEFEAKSKNFSKSLLGTVKEPSPLVVESMFWEATGEKPIYIEYANDVPGSGFGEPVGLLHYFHRGRRRRRKRNSFDRGNLGSSDNKNDQVDDVNSSRADKDLDNQNNRNLSKETASSSLPPSSEIEGTAGWKLSNSPWNLQVIARSPGSLTRFMPDDIPGVTSPMVYIGMLFSWFAWHVEDHELHSLNFLHIGSPKTWYAVPGDYAFNFEEVMRCHAYGGHTDRLVALSRLGEKTTVLSPEVIVAAGIPCCRLVQNPGEFVVTFPRAYHIGFSHGFNCGEAANFGTSKWLTVAKEAALRRAAMNYLPMLSHQQLLYLLTMSFILRIPRSLLPGVRSSRLKDRQKEERELSVKRAFIQDIVHENNLLTVLFQRNSSYHAVFWDVDSLPSPNKESELSKDINAATSISTENDFHKNDDSVDNASQLSEYISAVNFDLHGNDLAYAFQIDSGSLPCVACGILGFPFMAVVQPSEAALNNLLLEDHLASAGDAINKDKSTHLPPMEQSAVLKYETVSSKSETGRGWSISNVFLRPRIFCLEHALETEELLSSKGCANVLVICHSDFQKIKAHAGVVAEETATNFSYNEIPFGNASQEDLKLIDIAIDRDEQVDSAEDWTSLLNINLQHFVNVKRSFPSKKVQYLSTLGRLFSDTSHISSASSVKWTSRKLRSKRRLKYVLQDKSSGSTEIMQEDLKIDVEHETAKKDAKIIQYSRKRYKSCAPTIENGEAQKTNIPSNDSMEKGKIVSSFHVSQGNEIKVTDECLEKKDSDCSENLASSLSDENRQGPAKDSEVVSSNTESINESTEGTQIDQGSCDSVQKENDLGTKPEPNAKIGNKRKRDVSPQIDDCQSNLGGFIKSPCEGLRPRARKDAPRPVEEKPAQSKPIKPSNHSASRKTKKERQKGCHKCDLDGCTMSFQTKAELVLHKGNRCPVQGCRKKFNSHKYAMQHQRVHDDDRPLKCSWKGCTMSFKWAWARTEHLRVHTGERPYTCKLEGCGLTFRFVSDFSRHRRKTGHYVETN